MKWIPKVDYNSTTFEFSLPQKLWMPRARPVGGSDVSDAGVPESYVLRREQLMKTELRFFETEWADVDMWLEFVQNSQSFYFWFDKDHISTKYAVFLDMPALGNGEVAPSRDVYTKIYTLPVTIRTTDGSRFSVDAFSADVIDDTFWDGGHADSF